MKSLKIHLQAMTSTKILGLLPHIIVAGYILWIGLPSLLNNFNPTVGILDGSIWQLLFFAVISFLVMFLICLVLFKQFLERLALPTIYQMVSQFNGLMLWQQFVFYWASFALLLLASIMSLVAVF